MARESAVSDFELDGGRLSVTGVLDADCEEEFKARCLDLFLADAQTVEIDLSEVDTITSACIGPLVVLWIDLCAAERGLKLVASPGVEKVLDIAGLSGVFAGASGEEDSRSRR